MVPSASCCSSPRIGGQNTLTRWMAVSALTRSLMNKLLHAPLSRLKEAREDGSRIYVDAARVLFDLDDEGRSRRPRVVRVSEPTPDPGEATDPDELPDAAELPGPGEATGR